MKKISISVLLIVIAFIATVRYLNFYPDDVMPAKITCDEGVQTAVLHYPVKILNWNVQYMAGKDYVFYYDVPEEKGPDTRPSPEAITRTFGQVADLVKSENPDIVMLQEVDDGAKRTDYEDQPKRLHDLMAGRYPCRAEAFYWKSAFVPHPKIMGSQGIKLVTYSKYPIVSAGRYQLPLADRDLFSRQFYIKHALLEAKIGDEKGENLVAINTHLDAFSGGDDTMTRQTSFVRRHLESLDASGAKWIIGGDFNLLATKKSYDRLEPKSEQNYFNPKTELTLLTSKYDSAPDISEIDSPQFAKWFTHYPNDPEVGKIDRTIDYIFMSNNLSKGQHYVRQGDALKISDHMPLVLTVTNK